MKNYIQDGCIFDHTLSGNITSGDVVEIGEMVGIAASSGVSGDKIAVNLEGVYEVPKVTGAGKAFTLGQKVYSKGDGNVTPSADDGGSPAVAYKLAGYAWAAAAANDATVQLRLLNC